MTYVPSVGDAATKRVTLIPGDGIGPEVTEATCRVISALGAPIVWEKYSKSRRFIDLFHVFRFPNLSGSTKTGRPQDTVPDDVLESLKSTGVCLKGTLFTPMGGKNTNTQSLNVQLRKLLDLSVNLVHGFSIPGLTTRHSDMNIVVIRSSMLKRFLLSVVPFRENTEGEYSGLEHEVVPGVVESLKVITEKKSLRTARYAFEFAFLNNRKKVTAIHKANIMKLADGQFLKV